MKKQASPDVFGIADLRDWSESAGRQSIRFGIVGHPVEHSLSPVMHNAALRESGIKMNYVAFKVQSAELEEAINLFRANGFLGFNVTLPHKVAAAEFMDELDADARQIGAINTVTVRNQKTLGSNTDGIGFARAIRDDFSVDLRDLRILLIGAGGAANGIAYQCARENCERLVVANRTESSAEELTNKLQHFFAGPRVLGPVARLQAIGLNEMRAQIANTDLIVNATPLGWGPSDAAILPAHILEPHLMIYDTTYGSERTPLLRAASAMGARGANGLSMLLHQGARAFEIWHGREAPLVAMRAALVNR